MKNRFVKCKDYGILYITSPVGRKNFMKKALLVVLIGLMGFGFIAHERHDRASDTYIRDRVVKLQSKLGSCSGIQVKAPSGHSYILTAAHCRLLVDATDNSIEVVDEYGIVRKESFIEEDAKSDLMLITNSRNGDIEVAKSVSAHQHLHSLTHGAGFPTYRTDGELLSVRPVQIGMFEIVSKQDEDKCMSMPKYAIITDMMFGESICILSVNQLFTTVPVVPGSSGGAILDESGSLTGIVSATDGRFSTIVTLDDIHAFLSAR